MASDQKPCKGEKTLYCRNYAEKKRWCRTKYSTADLGLVGEYDGDVGEYDGDVGLSKHKRRWNAYETLLPIQRNDPCMSDVPSQIAHTIL